MIHTLYSRCVGLLTALLVRYFKPDAIASASNLFTLDFYDRSLQKTREDIVIGQKAKSYLAQCKEDGQMNSMDRTEFFETIRRYYATASTYIANKFPLDDPLLQKASVADIGQRQTAKFKDVLYFVEWFPCLLPESTIDELEMQFLHYQVDSLPATVLEAERLDVAWHLLGQLKECRSDMPKYHHLAKVMLGILVIPHSNADSERIFSSVRKNQTEFRPNLGVPVLESLLVTKTDRQARQTPCFSQDFSPDLLVKAKKATTRGLNSQD